MSSPETDVEEPIYPDHPGTGETNIFSSSSKNIPGGKGRTWKLKGKPLKPGYMKKAIHKALKKHEK